MRRSGRADAAKLVGAGRRQAVDAARGAGGEQRQCHGVRRAAQADGVLTTGGGGGDFGAARQDQRQRAGPEGVHQLLGKGGNLAGEAAGAGGIGHMDDQAGARWGGLWRRKFWRRRLRWRRLPPGRRPSRSANRPGRQRR